NSRRQPWQGCTLPLSYSRNSEGFLPGCPGLVKTICTCSARSTRPPLDLAGAAHAPAAAGGSDPLDADDARDLLEAADDLLQLGEVAAEEGEDVRRAAVVAGPTGRLADVDALIVERLADGREDAGPVRGRDLHL